MQNHIKKFEYGIP